MNACKELFDRLQQTGVVGRAYLFFVAGYVAAVSVFCDTTLLYHVFEQSSTGTKLVRAAMMTGAAMGLLDALINDVLPQKWYITSALRWRHMLLMVMSGCYAVLASTACTHPEGLWLVPFLVAGSAMFAASAFFDIRRRFKSK